MHSILSIISLLVFSFIFPASGTPYFPLGSDTKSYIPPTIEERTASPSAHTHLLDPVGVIEERDGTSSTEVAVYLEKRKGGGAGVKEDAEYTGSFGGTGLLGLGGGGLGVGTISTGALLVLGGIAIALILAMAGWALFEWWNIVQKFHNDNTNNWPIYDEQQTSNNGQSVAASWSIRTFSDDGCGNPGLDEHGSHPYSQDHNNIPVMMTEYISSDLHYNDQKPCESLMINSKYTVNSVAVWMSAETTAQNPGLALFYSHPLCHVKTDSNTPASGAPNGTIPTKPKDGYPDYMQAYNGSAVLYDEDNQGLSGPQPGQWACLKGRFLSFSIVFSGVTDVKVPYPGGGISAADTVPNPDKKGVGKDVGAIKANHPFMVTDIKDTYQTGSRSGYPGI